MSVITFLKERRKKLLIKRLNRLKELAKDYSISIDYYNTSIQSICSSPNCNAFSKTSYFLNSSFSSYCYTEELTDKYDYYDYYSFLYSKTIAKIEKLEKRLQKL